MSSVFMGRSPLGWYAEFFLKIILQFKLGKISARLNLTIMLNSLHIGFDLAANIILKRFASPLCSITVSHQVVKLSQQT